MKRWEDYRKKRFSKEQLEEIDRWVADESIKINLRKVRDLVGISQVEMAKKLKISQASVARREGREDHKLSTLREHIKALGGDVQVHAVFGDKKVVLDV